MSKGWAVAPAVILAGWMYSIPAAAQSTGSLPVTARVMSQEAGRSYVAALALMEPLSRRAAVLRSRLLNSRRSALPLDVTRASRA